MASSSFFFSSTRAAANRNTCVELRLVWILVLPLLLEDDLEVVNVVDDDISKAATGAAADGGGAFNCDGGSVMALTAQFASFGTDKDATGGCGCCCCSSWKALFNLILNFFSRHLSSGMPAKRRSSAAQLK
jgi:hypothetical protein